MNGKGHFIEGRTQIVKYLYLDQVRQEALQRGLFGLAGVK